jgi:hypothetical protein
MPRERLRVCLQDGLKLDLNRLIRRGFVRLGERTGPILMRSQGRMAPLYSRTHPTATKRRLGRP